MYLVVPAIFSVGRIIHILSVSGPLFSHLADTVQILVQLELAVKCGFISIIADLWWVIELRSAETRLTDHQPASQTMCDRYIICKSVRSPANQYMVNPIRRLG